ncbi:YveK family protein [Kocuria sp. M4R2S49]|uniref:YveK family protein n=1 Tax=Kocuria rhizosphaericola TaxID=3376284 RepID=UPI0037A26AA6
MPQAIPADQTRAPDMRDLTRLARTYWRGITLIVLVCTLLALGWSLMQPKFYSTTVRGLVIAIGQQDLSSRLAGDQLVRSKAAAYESLATSRPVAETVIDDLDLDTPPERILDSITVEVPSNSPEIRITAWDDSPEDAAKLADAWLTGLTRTVETLENSGDEAADSVGRISIQQLSRAEVPTSPTVPNTLLHTGIGVLVGLVLGLVYAFVRHRTNSDGVPLTDPAGTRKDPSTYGF